MSRFDLLLVTAVVVIIVVLASAGPAGTPRYAEPVQLALDELAGVDLHRRRTEGRVQLLQNGERHSAERLVRSLPESVNDRAVPIVIGVAGDPQAVGLARGVDRGYHVWQSFLERYVPFEVDNIWYPLLHLASRKAYIYDHEQHRIGSDEDLWQTSRQAFVEPKGDCEDHAILLADWLIGLGETARVAVGTHRGEGHAWVILIRDDREYLLEATRKHGLTGLKRYPLAALHPEYQPQYQFDRDHFWVYAGRAPTVRYRGEQWTRKSRYLRPAASRRRA